MTDTQSQQSGGDEPKAKKPWFKKKRWILSLGVLAIIVIGSAAGGGEEKKDTAADAATTSTTRAGDKADASSKTTTTVSTRLFPNRIDAQKEDQERNIGESVKFSGYTTTLNKAGFQQSINTYSKDGYLVGEVTIENRDEKAQSYNPFDWKVQTPSGQVLDIEYVSINGQLESGDLVKGGTVSGKVVFKVGSTKGDFYVIYKPDAFDAARGIWKVTV